jgi:hypothetical protein
VFQNLNLSTVTGDHNYIKGNAKFFSCSATGGGGPVYVLPYSQVGKIPSGYPTVNGHAGAVYDTDWCVRLRAASFVLFARAFAC